MKVIIRIAQFVLIFVALQGAYSLALYAGFSSVYGAAKASSQDVIGSVAMIVGCALGVFGLQRFYERKYNLPQISNRKALSMGVVGIIGAIVIALMIVAWIVITTLMSLGTAGT